MRISICLLYTSDAADDLLCVDLGGRRIIKKKIYSHHNDENYFVGKIDTKKNKIGINNSVSITGTAGTVVFFHCRSVHGSGHNQMNNSRPLILFGYRACDAWPLINDGNPHPEVDLENYDKNIIVGNKSIKPRLTKVPTIIPKEFIHETKF